MKNQLVPRSCVLIYQFLDVNVRGLLKVLVKENHETSSDACFYSFHMTSDFIV